MTTAAYQREYRQRRKAEGRPLKEKAYDYEKWRAEYTLRRYGITIEAALEMLQAQGCVCAICRVSLSLDNRDVGQKDQAHIDHDHKTGEVRGILCMHCNQGLGKFRDNPDLLHKAAAYLLP